MKNYLTSVANCLTILGFKIICLNKIPIRIHSSSNTRSFILLIGILESKNNKNYFLD